eukprot:gnl/TRDRNA2_/TRDRNA2_184027_c0_seq1.p1 gnl/TRDRNA2_/TRDRNA2_184027_c0~~gnl/TRDRNA2_/TRDRNA2_184027_c0_seq1.p1  ORF type:complete len:274 (+),score=33.17 gnl/TRDRNA2_/TRDRNA2_184027_c0_seq1:61-822(+)
MDAKHCPPTPPHKAVPGMDPMNCPPPPTPDGDAAARRKRSSVLGWDDYFMSVAFLTAMRSKDPSTQVGACIVNNDNRIVGVGYNGFPTGIEDDALPWGKKSPQGEFDTKYPYVCHAELNAVLNKNAESCVGCRIYSSLFPCNECAKVIIQAGIRKVVYMSDKHAAQISSKASRRLFKLAGVEMVQHVPEMSGLHIALRYADEVQCSPCPAASEPASSVKRWVALASKSSIPLAFATAVLAVGLSRRWIVGAQR